MQTFGRSEKIRGQENLWSPERAKDDINTLKATVIRRNWNSNDSFIQIQ